MRIFRTYVVFLFLFQGVAFSQVTKISGKILDATTKEPLPFVSIGFKNSKVVTSSDFDGTFSISSTTPTDSLIFSYVGYLRMAIVVKKGLSYVKNVEMKTNETLLNEVVILPGENPAWRILRNVIKNKKHNDKERLDAFEYEVYNKIEFDMNNIPKDVVEKKSLKQVKFIFDYIDSSNVQEKPYLPLIISEALSNFYYKKNPKFKKEIIRASKISGLDNEKSVSQFMGDMYQNVNIYDDNILFVGKNFVSPISDNGLFYYRYYLIDSLYIDGHFCYQLQFKPKRKQELLFNGNMWIVDTVWAVKRLEMSIASDANINFVNMLNVVQDYSLVDSTWMLSKDRLVGDFKLQKKQIGFYGRKTTSYRNIVVNKPREDSFYSKTDNLIVLEDAGKKTDAFWKQSRHDTLSKNEEQIYKMVDSLKNTRIYRSWQEILILFVTGYKTWNYVEIGPYYNMLSYNQHEGLRLRFGGRTSNKLSKWYEINGYAAYGVIDEKLKYAGEFKTFITKNPRQIVYFNYKNDYEILGQSQNSLTSDNILTSLFRRNPLNSLTGIEQYRVIYEYEPFNGWNNKLFFTHRVLHPLSGKYLFVGENNATVEKQKIITSEIKFVTRFAYDEKYVEGSFTRVSTGTKWPIIQVEYTPGLKGVLKSDYSYHKLYINIDDRIRINPIGYTNYVLEAGKIFGNAPYPLIFLHPGNETYVYDWSAYNLMNYYEFASDRFAAVSIYHHFDGFFLNKVPLMRKLKWREVFTAKYLVGSIGKENRSALIFPAYLSTLSRGPYYEVGAGIENILKILRFDAFWRLSYINSEYKDSYFALTGKKVPVFGIRGSIQIIF